MTLFPLQNDVFKQTKKKKPKKNCEKNPPQTPTDGGFQAHRTVVSLPWFQPTQMLRQPRISDQNTVVDLDSVVLPLEFKC